MRRATIRHRAGQAFAATAAIAAAWAFIVALSGGISIHTGVSRIGTRDPVRPLIVAAACAAVAWRLLGTAQSRRLAASVFRDRRKTYAGVAAIAAFGTLIVAIAWNTRAAGGSDSSCYVLQAEAFAHGRATLRPPLPTSPPVIPSLALAPIGFVPSPRPPHDAVPICAPGLALVMAPAALVSREAVFLIVPLFAAAAVWCTFLLGRALGDAAGGACAAVLLASSPIFLYQAVQPMSDVPAAALWLAALAALAPASRAITERARARRDIVAGICASLSVLMRPNMALIVLPLLLLLGRGAHQGEPAPARRWAAWLRFGAASLPALVTLLALNAARYGSPFASGYGATDVLFSFSHVGPNLARYPRWLIDTHSPLIALAAIAPFLSWRRELRPLVAAAAAAAALTMATYLAYTVFDDWWYIRFLLPAVPVAVVFAVIVAMRAIGWLLRGRSAAVRTAVACALTLASSSWLVQVARGRAVFELAGLEARFRLAGEYAGRALTGEAIVLGVQQSASIRYFGRRGTLTWDGLPAGGLDAAVAALAASGRTVYVALEETEEPRFRARFAGQRFGGLDWPPFAEVHAPARVRFYDPRQRDPYLAGKRYTVEIVGRVRTR